MIKILFAAMPGFIALFWLLLFLLEKKKESHKRFMIFFLIIAFISFTIHWAYFNQIQRAYNILDSIWVFTSLAVFPLYYYYIRLITKDFKINYRKCYILLLPLLIAVFSGILYLKMSPQELKIFNNEIVFQNKPQTGSYSTLIRLQILRMHLFKVFYGIIVITTVFYGLKEIKQFNKKLESLYSNLEQRKLSKIKNSFLALIGAGIISILFTIIDSSIYIS